MSSLAIFGIDGGALGLVINLLVLFLIVVYVALIYWTYLDAKRRIEDPVLIACATAASVFPFIGTVVYTILRPPEFLEDREERELELRAAELRLRQLIEQSCPYCEYPVERGYLRCPNCERRLRNPCRKCRKPLDPKWGICPHCETEVRRQRAERTERAPRRTAAGGGDTEAERRRRERQARSAARSAGSGRPGQRPAQRSDGPGAGRSVGGGRPQRPAGGGVSRQRP
jgi:uncharacterized Zn finger protein (UPF0148 family)